MAGFDKDYYSKPNINPLTGEDVNFSPRVTRILDLMRNPGLGQWRANEAAKKAWSVFWALAGDNMDRPVHAIIENLETNYEAYYNAIRYAAKDISETAKDKGSNLHDMIERCNKHILGQADLPTVEDMMLGFRDAYMKWAKKVNLEPLRTEATVVGPGYAGTLDLLARCLYRPFLSRDKKLQADMRNKTVTVVIDYVSAKGVTYPEKAYQSAAYRYAEELAGTKIDCNWVIRFNKLNGKMARPKDFTPTYMIDREVFMCCRNLWWLIWQRKQV